MATFKNIQEMWNYIKSGRPYIVAEAGVNHLGSIELGERLISEAAGAGANAVKFQSYRAKTLCSKTAPRFWNWEGEEKKGGTQYDSYSELDSFGHKEHAQLSSICRAYDVDYMSTPFDFEAADYLEKIGVLAYKMASCDITNLPLLEYVARKNKIMMLATGAASMDEIHRAVHLVNQFTDKIVVMQCTLTYPTKDDQANLKMITHLKEQFGQRFAIGLSDHTMNVTTPSIAYALGANVIEKHFTVDKTLMKSADHWLSADPAELRQISDKVYEARTLLGTHAKKICTQTELLARKNARRSIVPFRDIKEGEVFTYENLSCKRPGTGLSPALFKLVIGGKASRDLEEDELLKSSDILGGLPRL
tara:strand:- start:72 stop:1157 length:1086 start_codon:yes stop_codon:yes gene_type:complete